MTISGAIRGFVDRYPGLKAFLKAVVRPFRAETSTDYKHLASGDIESASHRLRDAWQAAEIPGRQRDGVDRQLAAYRDGAADLGFDVLIDMLRPLAERRAADGVALTVLEVGCSSGYYSEAFAIKGLQVVYSGCDYSQAFIEMARRHYPTLAFQVQDATNLGYGNDEFDVVVSGCCLLHIGNFEAAISEAARVAGSYVVFHRTPVLHRRPTTYYTKRAYGVETVEIHFNEQQLVALLTRHGLRIIGIATLHVGWQEADAFAIKSFLCEKVRK